MADEGRLGPATRILAQAVGTAYPGAALGVAFPDGGRAVACVGATAYPGHDVPVEPIASDTVFDLASLTKPLALVPVFLALHRQGRLGLDDRLSDPWPRFAGTSWGQVTMAHLLAHASGLPAWRPFAADLAGREGLAVAGTDAACEAVVARIAAERPEAPPGCKEIYSDLGFILLGMLTERLGGDSLARLFAEWVAAPLGLRDTFFVPVRGGQASGEFAGGRSFATTERCPTRGRFLRGEVHDDNAWLLGGAAGHAGLFSTVDDTLVLVRSFSDAALGRDDGPFAGVGALLTRRAGPPDATRVMGFDTPAPVGSGAGDRAPAGTLGHLGFTGTSFWVQPSSGAAVVMLTNRVHPTRTNEAIRQVRPRVHDAVWGVMRPG